MHLPLDLKGATFEQVAAFVAELGERPYRARQLYRWVFARDAASIAAMTDLAGSFRTRLVGLCAISRLRLAHQHLARDGTRKFLFRLQDGEAIETVLIPTEGRLTLCLSTQVGCKLACDFCRTGEGGFARNLTPAEIVDQYLAVQREVLAPGGEKITNLVFMGMGEPLDNYADFVQALRILTAPAGLHVAPRRITLSTAGLVPRMEQFGREGIPVKLAVSLNATTDEQRNRLMPINRSYDLARLLQACRAYPLARRDRITFEYVLLGEVNDTPEDAQRLCRLVQGIRCKINLIPFNPFATSLYRGPQPERVQRFLDILVAGHCTATLRESRGVDIEAACGQLRTSAPGLAEAAPLALHG
ncbi:MAG: 23S rRNA (adenine(2503)-C(2))-methyltransferase RlmN [Candidatus Tectomicrobia bacterium]|nr:23S rRNA (adenine(2503)-C(2))-methyltransferase RlmN [Candidatus Tectomicrobia bacterium]